MSAEDWEMFCPKCMEWGEIEIIGAENEARRGFENGKEMVWNY